MIWSFSRHPPDRQLPVHFYELRPESPSNVFNFGTPPEKSVRDALIREWYQPSPDEPIVTAKEGHTQEGPQALTVPWSAASPTAPGLYWWASPGASHARLAVVLLIGGRPCIHERRGDSARYTSVGVFNRLWAGPIAIPAGMSLESMG